MHRYVVHRQVCLTCASIVPGQQIHNDESQEAFQDSGYFSKISDISVVLWKLSLSLHTSLSLLSIESLLSSNGQEGSGGQKKSHQNI